MCRWRKFQDALLKTCWIWFSNTEEKKRTNQAEIKLYDAEFANLPEVRIKKYTENFREFKLQRIAIYLIARKNVRRAESLELPMCLIIPFWITQSAGNLGLPKKQQELWFGQFYWDSFNSIRFCKSCEICLMISTKISRDLKSHFSWFLSWEIVGYKQKDTNMVVLQHRSLGCCWVLRSLRSAITLSTAW